MNPSSSAARTYRLLCWLALAHALVLFALLWLLLRPPFAEAHWVVRGRLLRGWVGLVTLWIFWPPVLLLHRGRTARRLALFAPLSAVLLLPSLSFYNGEAPMAFGLPLGVSMTPVSCWEYFSAYRAGRAEASKDVAAGIMAREVYGFGAGFGPGPDILRDRYRIEVRPVAACIVDEKIVGHAAGYNEIADREIDRRVGRARVEAAMEEGFRIAKANREHEVQLSEELAKRLTSLPPDAQIRVESVWPYSTNGKFAQTPEAEAAAAQTLHTVESYLLPRIPKDAPSFRVHITAHGLARTGANYDISSHDHPPQALWEKLYRDLRISRRSTAKRSRPSRWTSSSDKGDLSDRFRNRNRQADPVDVSLCETRGQA